MKHNGFVKMLLSYLPVFFVTISALIFLFFMAMADNARREAEQAGEIYAKQVLHSLDVSLQFVEQLTVKEVLTNESFDAFLDKERSNDPFVGYQVASRLGDLLVAAPLVDSAYLYRAEDHTVLSASHQYAPDQFGDRPHIEASLRKPPASDWGTPRMYQESRIDKLRQVISLTKPIPLGGGGKGMIVVNLSVARLKDEFREMARSDFSYLELRDSEDRLIADSEELKTPYEGPYLARLPSETAPWEIRVSVRGGTSRFSLQSAVWLAAGSLVVLLGLLWLMAIIRRHHRPVQTIFNRIYGYTASKLDVNPKQGELKYIELAIGTLLTEAREGREYRNRKYFQEILDNLLVPERQEWQESQPEFPWPEPGRKLAVWVAEVDRYDQVASRYSERDLRLLQYVVSNVAGELARESELDLLTEWVGSGRLVGLLACRGEDSRSLQDAAAELGEKLRGWISEHLAFTVTIGIGEPFAEMGELSVCYDEALQAVGYRSTLGDNRVISQTDLVRRDKPGVYDMLQAVGEFSRSYRVMEQDWEARLASLFERIEEGMFSRSELTELMDYLLYAVQRGLADVSSEYDELWQTEAAPELRHLLASFHTLDELRGGMTGGLVAMAARLKQVKESRSHYALMQSAKAYIEQQYANPDLSLVHVSEQLGMSYSQLSRLFKEQHGEKFVDYTAKWRMNKAKELLEATEEPIQDIARRVGYLHAFSFIRTFKKLCGMTPGEYRLQYGRGNSGE